MKHKTYIISVIVLISITYLCPASFADNLPLKKENVSGYFYPSSEPQLAEMIDKFLSRADAGEINGRIKGIISPHAGYIYSGPVAAYAYKAIDRKEYKTVVIIGTSHHYRLRNIALYKEGSFQTPLGRVPVDAAFAAALAAAGPNIVPINSAFEKEHSVEVQIPFLQRTLSGFSIVPVIIGNDSLPLCEELAAALKKVICSRDDVLIIASSDMSHYYEEKAANEMDAKALTMIKKNEPYKLFYACTARKTELCGFGAVVTLMITMKNLGAADVSILRYATSAAAPDADKDHVVGYTSVVFSAPESPVHNLKIEKRREDMLTQEQKQKLLNVARASINKFVKTGKRTEVNTDDAVFLGKSGAFVTIYKNGILRGCIGRIAADKPMIHVVNEMAVEAASADPRFPPLQEHELNAVSLEISVLSPLKLITDIDEIEVGTHGIIIQKEFYSGLLLPQVAVEYGWTREEFLQHTCLKAGLGPNDWQKGAQIYIFSAEVFGDKEKY
ncbi:MAG: AmmeMemoRadiSam system protein B [Candidatus Omnitrophica bacterium]|nr:AmmeMemoRadiSam system protein B [Candidatus Omnitrophota bacterium]MBU4478809.1 AmmeMemoRadiSam system protein B [Candidatus Omnitrophota bacterium]MCG2702880.1 AmmeMemoRadiSam system protein B [Candidatus Omnitrophota bacterium]